MSLVLPANIQSPVLVASDGAASTTHQVTLPSAIRAQGGANGPSAISFAICYDNGTGGIGTSVTDNAGNIYTRIVNEANAANGFTLEVWEAHDCMPNVVVTLTWTGSSSVKAKLGAVEMDQVAFADPRDGTSTPFNQKTSRSDTTNSTSRSSATTNATKLRDKFGVFIGWIGWNDTRTISSAGSTWGSLAQVNGGSTNLGLGVERKTSEVANIAGSQNIARFTMSGAAGTQPAVVAACAFFRDCIITSTDEDGYIDDLEGVSSLTTSPVSGDFVFRSSASAPSGGTGSSENSTAYHFLPRFYGRTGVTVGATLDMHFTVIDGFADGTNQFGPNLYSFLSNQIGSTLTAADEFQFPPTVGPQPFSMDLNVAGFKTITVTTADFFAPGGLSALRFSMEGDGQGSGTGDYFNMGDYTLNSPLCYILTLNYPVLAGSPQRTLVGVGI